MPYPFWTLVLAGGQGSRLNTVTDGVPKQFWSPDGSETMVERTIGRISGLVPTGRTVTVIGPGQLLHVQRVKAVESLGEICQQPADRGTGIATLWGLCHILVRDPEAIVMMTPADHGVDSDIEYRDGVRVAVRAVASGQAGIVLFGVTPSHPAKDYGWIVPAPSGEAVDQRQFRPVAMFAEKPSAVEAGRLMAQGALWNTMVLVARGQALLEMFRHRYPNVVDQALALARTNAAAPHLQAVFRAWPTIDLSKDVLSRADNLSVYTWRPSLGWCDLGTEDRLREWQRQQALERFGQDRRPEERPLTVRRAAVTDDKPAGALAALHAFIESRA